MTKSDSKLDLNGTGTCASFNFRRTARAVTKLYDLALQKSGLRSTQFTILVGIAKNQPVAIGALADVLIIDRTTLTRSLRLLEKERLIAISDRVERRQRFLSLTAKGARTLARGVAAWRKAQEKFVAAVGSEYWTNLRGELERLANIAVELENPKAKSSAPTVPGTPHAEEIKPAAGLH